MSEQTTPQPTGGQTVYVQQAPAQGNGMATASLVLGIIALVMVWIPLIGMIAWILAPLGLIFGLISLGKPTGRGLGIAGTICSAIALLACIGWLLLFGAAAAVGAAAEEGETETVIESSATTTVE